jgi:hypothetical protein
MLRRFLRLSLLGKIVVLLIAAMVIGYSTGNQGGASIGAVTVLILVGVFFWWIRSKATQAFVFITSMFPARRYLSRPGPVVIPSRSQLPPRGTTPLQPSIHSPGIGDVLALTPGQFEDMTALLLKSLGYTDVERTGKAGDLGADITCRDPNGRTAIVQCKRYGSGATIGTPVVQTFIGMMSVHHRVERGLIVATVPFTTPAIELARRHGIALIDGPALLLLLHLTGISLYPQAETYVGQN